MRKKIAVLAGDGIGPEVMKHTLRVLDCIGQKFSHQFDCIEGDIGGYAFERHQSHLPAETIALCQGADAILFGSVGGAINQQHERMWKNCEANSILALRKRLNLTTNIRPVTLYPELAHRSPLQKNGLKGVDFVIFRELSGGIYFGEHQHLSQEGTRVAVDTCVYDEEQIKTIAHAAFQTAIGRKKTLCSVDKANVLATSALWREIINEVARFYPDVEVSHQLVDNCAMQIIINPQQFDVIVTENMFGDILSDLAAALPGSLGLTPSASVNAKGLGLYEPSGGSAPDIAGKNRANPCAQLLSAAMMLRHSFNMEDEACLIEQAIQSTFVQEVFTQDLAQDERVATSTSEFINCVVGFIEQGTKWLKGASTVPTLKVAEKSG